MKFLVPLSLNGNSTKRRHTELRRLKEKTENRGQEICARPQEPSNRYAGCAELVSESWPERKTEERDSFIDGISWGSQIQ
jgi:hypothetical protein